MAMIPLQASAFLLSECCPQALRDWILQDLGWKAEDIREIEVEYFGLDARYWKYGSLVEVSVTRNNLIVFETRKRQFLCLPNGNWQKHEGWIESNNSVFPVTDWQISYTPDFETKVEKQEMTDSDVFDLMDSIREEMKY